jgi:chorismate mutase/GNAT superfamily N-acetyltransferase
MAPMPAELTLRPATPEDLPGVAEVHLAARADAVPAMPALVRSAEEVRAFFSALDLASGGRELWVAEGDGTVVGYAELKGAWLDDLYVTPRAQGDGVGSALLDLVKGLRPTGFCLWVFESNEAARRFYARHGLITLERTDGSANEEKAPDIRMAWAGERPLPFLRSLIDEVDDELAGLLARRVALTAAVQQRKPVGGPEGRDDVRERQIAERMGAAVPVLGTTRMQRIVHTIITESLDVARLP